MTAHRHLVLAGITARSPSPPAPAAAATPSTVNAAPKPEPLAVAHRDGRQPADRSLSPRHRIAARGRAGRSERRSSRPRDRDTGRTRLARCAGGGSRAHLAGGDIGAAARGRSQRGTARGAARSRGRAAVRSDARSRCVEREGGARSRRSRVHAHRFAPRAESRFAERVRPAQDAGGRGTAAVPDGAERRAAVLPIARSGQRAGRARAQGRGRHDHPCAVRRPGRRTGRQRRRLRHPGARVATVVRVDPMRIELTIPEQSVSLIKAGQPVRVAVEAYPGETFKATVRYVSPSLRPTSAPSRWRRSPATLTAA